MRTGMVESAPGRFLVRFRDGLAADTRCSINTGYGCRQMESIPGIDVAILTVPKNRSLDEILGLYQRHPHVEFAEPDFIAHTALTPSDPLFESHQHSLRTVGAPEAWRVTTGNADVALAVLDTGVEYTHPDLAGRLMEGFDFIRNSGRPHDDHGHGTGVAGIIGAATNNGRGIAGITWHNPLLPVRVLGRDGSGTYSAIAKGLVYAADRGARVINLSLGGARNSSTLRQAVEYAHRKQAVIVAAAGNADGPVLYPAAFPDVIAVAAVDDEDRRANYSNYGPEVSVSAPGNNIWSTTIGGGYRPHSGTSFAAPMVAGLAGLILGVRPRLGPREVRRIIEESALDLGIPGWDKYHGWGRIEMAAALTANKKPVD